MIGIGTFGGRSFSGRSFAGRTFAVGTFTSSPIETEEETTTPVRLPVSASVVYGENRGYDNRFEPGDESPIQVTLEFINETIMEYFQNTIQPNIDDNGTARPVPILYGTAERWANVRQHGALRDQTTQKLLTPMIMLRRTNVSRSQPLNPNNKYLYMSSDTGWNVRNAYDKFAVLNNITPSKHLRKVMVPDYMELTYEVILWTEYQEQMDGLIEQINVESEDFWGKRNNFKFRVAINEFVAQSDLPANQDRIIRTTFQMKVSAYLIPERMIKNFKMVSTSEKSYTAKKVVAFTEIVNNLKNTP